MCNEFDYRDLLSSIASSLELANELKAEEIELLRESNRLKHIELLVKYSNGYDIEEML